MAGDGLELPIFELPLVLLPGRAAPAAHLRGALQADDRPLSGGRRAVRDRLSRRGARRAAGRLRGAGDRGHRALRRRPAEHHRHRRAPVPGPRPLRGFRTTRPARSSRSSPEPPTRPRADAAGRGPRGVRRPRPPGRRRAAGARRARGATTPTGSRPGSSCPPRPSSGCSSCAPSPSGCGPRRRARRAGRGGRAARARSPSAPRSTAA